MGIRVRVCLRERDLGWARRLEWMRKKKWVGPEMEQVRVRLRHERRTGWALEILFFS